MKQPSCSSAAMTLSGISLSGRSNARPVAHRPVLCTKFTVNFALQMSNQTSPTKAQPPNPWVPDMEDLVMKVAVVVNKLLDDCITKLDTSITEWITESQHAL